MGVVVITALMVSCLVANAVTIKNRMLTNRKSPGLWFVGKSDPI